MSLLEIKDLHVAVGGKEILKGLSLSVNSGEIHAIMGPNGSGKSTLTQAIAGREGYEITQGEIYFEGKNIQELAAEDRARAGIFLGFQYPIEIPGVSNSYFLKTALNAIRSARGEKEIDAIDFLDLVKKKMRTLEMNEKFLKRNVNEGFSGGEKKRNEILQMLVLEPTLCLLDETDSGLDIDSLKIVAAGVNSLKSSDRAMVLVTHYQRLLEYIIPDYVHVLKDGRIVHTGDKELALHLEEEGYGWVLQEANTAEQVASSA